MLIGYARASIEDRRATTQHNALQGFGCEQVFTDSYGGAKTERPALAEVLHQLCSGDTLVVWRLDRIGYSLKHLIEIVADLERRGIGFVSVIEKIDTREPNSTSVVALFQALDDFQHELTREQTLAGLAAARARGRNGGRKRKLDDEQKIAAAQTLYEDKAISIAEICAMLEISKSTLYRYITPTENAEYSAWDR